MRPLILASSFLFLVLSNVVRAEEVYLNCKFQSGSGDDDFKNTYTIKKGELGTEDINITLDTRKKKIIKAPNYSPQHDNKGADNSYGNISTYTSKWSENEIIWDQTNDVTQNKLNSYAKNILNRRSGVLDTNFTQIDKRNNTRWDLRKSYLCTKESKKF